MDQQIKGYASKIIEEMDAKRRERMERVKNKIVTARLTQEQYDVLNTRCAAQGLKVARFCEEAILVAVNGLAV